MDLDGVLDEGEADMMRELENSSLEDVQMRQRLLENEIRVLRDESNRLALDLQGDKEKVKENFEKIKMNKQLPYLVGNVVEILDLKPEVRPVPHSHRPDRDREPGFPFISDDPDLTSTRRTPHLTTSQDEEEDDGANVDLDSKRQGKAVVLKTTTRQTILLPVIGLVDGGERTRRPEKIQPPLSFSVVTHRTDGSSGAFFYPSSAHLASPTPTPTHTQTSSSPRIWSASIRTPTSSSTCCPPSTTAASRRWRLTRSPPRITPTSAASTSRSRSSPRRWSSR